MPNPDSVNNVENVYLFPPLATNYSVTVYAHRVNVNAVTMNTNNVVQDYALVVCRAGTGDGEQRADRGGGGGDRGAATRRWWGR